MSTDSSAPSQHIRNSFDSGPLSWVMSEIREALAQSETALSVALTQDIETQATSLRHAKAYLHQAHGALQMVDIDGVAIVTETAEDLLERVLAGQLVLGSDNVQAIQNACHALIEYLEELLSGAAHQPVRLFPYYKVMLEARGAERIHPADLFFPDLTLRPRLPERALVAGSIDYGMLRLRFEKTLLPFLTSTDPATVKRHATTLSRIIDEIERVQSGQQLRAFWRVMHAFSEAVVSGEIPDERYVKQLFARINLQLRRLNQGAGGIAERVLRDALFFLARVDAPSPRTMQVRQTYQLDGLVPTDYGDRRYGQINMEALLLAKGKLAHLKNSWSRIASGDGAPAATFEQDMNGLAQAASQLNSAPLAKLLRELNGIARHAAYAKPGDRLGLEMATSLLFVENALGNIGQLPDGFSDQADALTARLLSVAAGEVPTDSAEWLNDISRAAQQQQTMLAVAAEMRNSLRQVEKILDEYFTDPSKQESLAPIDPALHQIEGALSILDQNDAQRAVQHTRAAIQSFVQADADQVPSQQEFQHVAQNVGALSFFIETLQLHTEDAGKRFSFDEAAGMFRANLLEKNRAEPVAEGRGFVMSDEAESVMGTPLEPDTESEPETVEQTLSQHQQQSADLALSLSVEPQNPELQEQLRKSLHQVRDDATLVDNPEANSRAQTAIDLLEHPDFSHSGASMSDIVVATSVKLPQHERIVANVAVQSDEAIDTELLEIFLSEAEEVLACISETIPAARHEPHNQDHLTTLRRSFHTLKGSSRMVGLNVFGEAAWGVEQVLNLWLSEARKSTPDLCALLEHAAETLGSWALEIKANGYSNRSPQALVDLANGVRHDGKFQLGGDPAELAILACDAPAHQDVGDEQASLLEESVADAVSAESTLFPIVDEAPATLLQAEEVQLSDAELEAFDQTPFEAQSEVQTQIPTDADALNLEPEVGVSAQTSDRSMAEQATVEPTAAEPARAEHANAAHLATSQVNEQERTTDRSMADEVIEKSDLPELAIASVATQSQGEVLEFTGGPAASVPDDGIKRIGELEISVPLHTIYLAETDQLVRLLANDFAEWRHEPLRHVAVESVHAAHSLAGSSATVGFNVLQEVAHGLERVLMRLSRQPVTLVATQFDVLDICVALLKRMLQQFALGEMPSHEPQQVQVLEQLLQELVAKWDASEDAQIATALEPQGEETSLAAPVEVPAKSLSEGVTESTSADATEALPTASPIITSQPRAEMSVTPPPSNVLADPTLQLTDDLDFDLLPVFIEEARDLLPQMGQALRLWQQTPADGTSAHSILRYLHTLKGSARMAGGMILGQHLHDMETRVEQIAYADTPTSSAVEELLARHDYGLHLFELLQNPGLAQQTPIPTAVASDARGLQQPVVLSTLMPSVSARLGAAVAHPSSPQAAMPLVRVRADILDRLVNQAGEVSISRSRLETEVGTLQQSLSELNENVGRLRSQLREIEMQAETQIASRMTQSGDREFDPLEFDRFTRLQELTRMMAESVNDVASVQQNLARTVDSATDDLTVQARLTRDLQQDLMRVRMVQFASISERLYRVTRQAAKEIDKRVNLDIRGSAVEIDRGVLEKMAGPFEHLLRNAIVHGIETREARRANGKNEAGELRVEVRQEGNEVVIQFADDGQGLNLTRIRDKAQSAGLLTAQRVVSDAEVTDLIFNPGFSTADEITELAGRGIGMDVVRSEAAALGGRIEVRSEPGQGAQFTIHLPLTLAVTQVVLLATGGKTYAVPSVLVEQVQQLKANALAGAYNDGAVIWQGARVPLHYLSALLGDAAATPVAQQYSPLVILKSGSERVAIHVDEVVGNREVVVKNIGPQLARLIGIAGATVLGSGEIVMILNPVPLAIRAAQEQLRAPRNMALDDSYALGAVAEMHPIAAPVTGLRTQNIVMVVDDSLTVRRVTQRLLSREGFQVVLAKDGIDALQQLQVITPDVMLVDIEMPRMDGFDLTRNVRGDERTRHIPIIMITSRTAAKHRNYAMELGVDEYLGKPYREEDLLGAIKGFIQAKAPVA